MSSTIYKNKLPLIIFLVPALILMTIFLYYPFIMNIFNSFSDISGLGTAAKGLNEPWFKNYIRLFQDPNMITAVKNTMILMFSTIVFQVGIALLLAIFVDSIKIGSQFFRTVYFFPLVISATALGLLFNLVFLYDGGMLNQILQKFFGFTQNIDWKDENHFMLTMLSPVMWQYVGFYFVIIVTGLSNIPQEIFEAASLDGAGFWKRTYYISLPMIRNVFITCLILAITGALKVFDLPWVMMGSGIPMDESWLTGTYMYNQTFLRSDVDYGSTIAVVIVILGVVISQIANKIFKEKEY